MLQNGYTAHIAITLPCNTVRIIFAVGLKGDKFKGYIEILSASIVLLNKYVKFQLDLKKQIGDKARYIKFNTANIETGFGFKSCKKLSGSIYEIQSYLTAHGGFTGDVRRIRRRDAGVMKGTDTIRARMGGQSS